MLPYRPLSWAGALLNVVSPEQHRLELLPATCSSLPAVGFTSQLSAASSVDIQSDFNQHHLVPVLTGTPAAFMPSQAVQPNANLLVAYMSQDDKCPRPYNLIPPACVLFAHNKRGLTDNILTAKPFVDYKPVMYTSAAPFDQGTAAKRMRLSDAPTKPSRVIHIYGLPHDTTEAELIQLTQLFGEIVNIKLTRTKNQALIEMKELEAAKQMVSYYGQVAARIRSQIVHVQYSNHEQLRVEKKGLGLDQATAAGDGSGAGDTATSSAINNVLRVIVDNMIYPVSLETLHQLFSKYGRVPRIITFLKNNSFHALIEFEDAQSAQSAKMALNGQNVYNGCCSLHIDYSKLSKLSIRYNNTKSRDFTNDSLPNDEDPRIGLPGYGGVMYQQGYDGGRYCVYPGGSLGYGMMVGPVGHHGPQGMFGGQHSRQSSNSIILVSNLNADKVTPDSLFTLFGVYGDVTRIKILFNKKDTALIQYANSEQAERALENLDFVRIWGKQIKLSRAKLNVVQMPKEGTPGAELTQDYSRAPSHKHRFSNSRGNYEQHIAPPSETLYLSNIPNDTKEADIRSIFEPFGRVVNFKFFEKYPQMALLQMESAEQAIMALMGLHNFTLGPNNHLYISFTRKKIGGRAD